MLKKILFRKNVDRLGLNNTRVKLGKGSEVDMELLFAGWLFLPGNALKYSLDFLLPI